MKSLLVLVTGCLLAVTVSAQQERQESIELKAQTIAQDLQYNGRNLTREQRFEISRNLDAIRRIMKGGSTLPLPPPPPPLPAPTSNYTCVSRDNDGRNPYVLGIREGINVTRIMAATFSTEAECQGNLNSIRYVGGKSLLCLSRDNDGRNPFLVASLSGGRISRIIRTVVSTKGECDDLLGNFRPDRNNNVSFCTSRDNDGRVPYVAAILNLNSESIQTGSESFSSLGACKSFLGQ
ncbi:hypothetical protein [Bdellovibrio svalbardensis]|uniref:Uncharacterized protein n=1 Tax=Bdellovibrio svalbardensis TaxID=2972972 RepID=A0ABT6DEQ9_9BACT|nr:hypothetical protein [Bdellovibrio svalbardensis]MDG0815324.1 hypothetical protein [Bdellovibrio svalbardensis]